MDQGLPNSIFVMANNVSSVAWHTGLDVPDTFLFLGHARTETVLKNMQD